MKFNSQNKCKARQITALFFGLGFIAYFIFGLKILHQSDQTVTETTTINEADTDLTESDNSTGTTENTDNDKEAQSDTVTLPTTVHLSVPFISQAPLAQWDALHEDACEEASLLIVSHYYNKTNFGSSGEVDSEIKDLVAFEEANGYGTSITLAELASVAKIKFNLVGTVAKNKLTVENIKQELAAGNPIIVGAAGKILPNPNFRNGGPNYHMLVIIGYDSTHFITNDPGTRNGKDFLYEYNDLLNAIHDWNPDNILNGEKNYLVFR